MTEDILLIDVWCGFLSTSVWLCLAKSRGGLTQTEKKNVVLILHCGPRNAGKGPGSMQEVHCKQNLLWYSVGKYKNLPKNTGKVNYSNSISYLSRRIPRNHRGCQIEVSLFAFKSSLINLTTLSILGPNPFLFILPWKYFQWANLWRRQQESQR